MARVVCFGELLVDMVSEAPDASLHEAPRFLKAPGGAPANVAVGLARLGIEAGFVGQVGRDPFGDFLSDVLQREGVDVSHLLRSERARTTLAFIATRRDGRKDICFYRNPGADALLDTAALEPRLKRIFEDARIFHCGSVSLSQSPAREAQLHLARRARERGLLVCFDPNWRPSLWSDHEQARALIWQMMALCDVVKIADEEWEFVTGTSDLQEGIEKIHGAGPRLLVVTRGANGAFFHGLTEQGETVAGEAPGLRVSAVDTLGAGDAFVAGLLSRLALHETADEALKAALDENALPPIVRFANVCGAFATQGPGAIPSLPTRAQAEELLARTTAE